MSEPMLRVIDAHKSYGRTEVLHGVDLEMAKGDVLVIIGPSGSGKSTLLRCINHLEVLDSGRIYVDGELVGYREENGRIVEDSEPEVARKRSSIGMVFQRFNLFPHLTALGNVTTGPVFVKGMPRKEAEASAKALLERVGLGAKLNAYPSQLSGGQQQRVAIARALAMEPKLMMFDEPTSALDPELVGEVLEVMRTLARDSHMTMIVVTHEIGFARDVATRALFMDEGRIVEQGSPQELFDTPKQERTRTFLGMIG